MAVGASKPTVLADADGFFRVKSKMLVSYMIYILFLMFMPPFMLRTTLYNARVNIMS
jgi:hypothetical protein